MYIYNVIRYASYTLLVFKVNKIVHLKNRSTFVIAIYFLQEIFHTI